MELSKGKFENLDHTVYGGENLIVPLLVNRESGLTDDSQALLLAVNIIGANLIYEETDIGTMFDRLASSLQDEKSKGIIIEDPFGKGSLNVGQETTTVSIKEVGNWEIPTNLLFDMALAWAEASDKDF